MATTAVSGGALRAETCPKPSIGGPVIASVSQLDSERRACRILIPFYIPFPLSFDFVDGANRCYPTGKYLAWTTTTIMSTAATSAHVDPLFAFPDIDADDVVLESADGTQGPKNRKHCYASYTYSPFSCVFLVGPYFTCCASSDQASYHVKCDLL